MSKDINQNLDANLSKNVNLDEKSSEAQISNENKENLSHCDTISKAQKLFKNALEISMQGISCALIYAGKAGIWLLDATNSLKDEAQRAELSRINEERAKFDGASIILQDKVKDIVANRLKTDADGIEFAQIYLAKKCALGFLGEEYFYEIKAKFNGFSYDFKISAVSGEILNLKIKS